MSRRLAIAFALAFALALLGAGALIGWHFNSDMQRARAHAHAAQGSVLLQTRCGPIEYQESGTGIPLLAVHGSGGGHDQGMAFASNLTKHGIRVIAMSRFGYLRTPMPADASASAQADAHVCLLDALGIQRAAVMGGSAGGPSALQMALRQGAIQSDVSAATVLLPRTAPSPSGGRLGWGWVQIVSPTPIPAFCSASSVPLPLKAWVSTHL